MYFFCVFSQVQRKENTDYFFFFVKGKKNKKTQNFKKKKKRGKKNKKSDYIEKQKIKQNIKTSLRRINCLLIFLVHLIKKVIFTQD